jgi:hypothetical protein
MGISVVHTLRTPRSRRVTRRWISRWNLRPGLRPEGGAGTGAAFSGCPYAERSRSGSLWRGPLLQSARPATELTNRWTC